MNVLALFMIFFFQLYSQSLNQNVTRPNIVMVMSDAFVSMKLQCFIII